MTYLPGPVLVLHGPELLAAHRLAIAGQRYLAGAGAPLRTIERALLTDLTNARNDHLSQAQRQPRPPAEGTLPDSPMTAAELAQQRGVHVRTIQRHAETYGGWKYKGRWIFPADLRY